MNNCAKKRGKFKARFILTVFIILLILAILFIYIEVVVNPIVLRIAKAQVDAVSTTAVSDAIYDAIKAENVSYNDLVDVRYGSDGNVSSIIANFDKVNDLARVISTYAQNYLDKLSGDGVKIPIGAFTGLEAFTQFGPKITLRLMPIGSVITSFKSTLDNAGINNVRHSLYIDVNTVISVILPTSSQKIEFVTSALVYETLLAGKVPDVYLSGL